MSYAIPCGPRGAMLLMMGHKHGRGRGSRRGYGMGPGPFFPGRPRVSRGDVRAAILHLLGEEPMHGYQIMSELGERTDGVWQPSPGSIYPTLNQLEDEGLVVAEESDGKKVYTLTDTGRAELESDEGEAPWESFSSPFPKGVISLRDAGFQLGAAVMQIAREGTEEERARARAILDDARRKIYEILAGGDPEE